jgi:hypothetical protein
LPSGDQLTHSVVANRPCPPANNRRETKNYGDRSGF